MQPWLVENFNGGSCMFTVGIGKEFVVTKNDAWRSDFDVSDKQSIPLAKLECRMQELVDGGVAFKRTISLKLLKAIEEVDDIKTFDWCSYVLRKLKKYVDKYNKDLTVQSMSGCLLVLLILYFHRLNFQGQKESCSLPLIQNWTDAKFAISQTVVKQQPLTLGSNQGGLNVGGACSSGTIGRFVQFELPDGVMSDDEGKQISNDDPVAVSQTQQLLYDPHYHKLLDANREEDVPNPGNNEDVPDLGNNQDILEPDNNQGVPQPIRSNKSLCSLDCGPVGQKVPFVTLFYEGENLVNFGMNFLVPREDMVSISSPLKIRWCNVDCYALYLNEFTLLYVCELEKGDNSDPVKDLHDLWEGWICYENPGCDMDAELIYVLILVEEHYVLFVVDHTKEFVDYLDNIIWCDATLEYFKKLSFHLCDQLGDFLGKRNHPKSTHLPFYEFKVVDLLWRKTKIDNTDCGVADVLAEEAKFNERKKNADYVKEIEEIKKKGCNS
uniref:Uncharacterized protein n=1 Tax=Chenopodium quinoa TaxID=63459 RepID=A0A803LIR7_CHEQI